MPTLIQKKTRVVCRSRSLLGDLAQSCKSIAILRMVCVLLYFSCEFARASDGILIEPEKAFRFSARTVDAMHVEVVYTIAPGYSLYRDRFRFEVEPHDVVLGAPQIPPGKPKEDPFFGTMAVFRDEVKILLPLTRANPAVRDVRLKITSQGCADVGVCYVPQEDRVNLRLPAAVSATPPPHAPALETK